MVLVKQNTKMRNLFKKYRRLNTINCLRDRLRFKIKNAVCWEAAVAAAREIDSVGLLRSPRRTTCITGLYRPDLVLSGLGEHLCYCIIIRLFRNILDISKGKKGKHMPLCIRLSLYYLYTKGEPTGDTSTLLRIPYK